MKFQTLSKLEYRGCRFYLCVIETPLDSTFIVLILYNNELYPNIVKIKPTWYRRFNKYRYTKVQLGNIIKLLIEDAHIVIDELIKKNAKQNAQSKTSKPI